MGKKNSTTTSQVSIPPEVLARYNAVNTQAEKVSQTPFQAFGSSPSDFVAQMNNQQGAGINRINETAGSYQPYLAGATGATLSGMGPASEGIDRYMSPYIKNVADTTGALMKQQQEQAQSGALGTAISSGAFGGDRAGIAAANLQQQQQMGYGKTMADIYNQGYTQALGASQADLGRQLQGGAQLAGLGAQSQELGLQGAQAQIAAGTMQQQTEQAGKDAMIKSFMQEKGYPFQVAQFLANIAMGTGALSGSTTTATQPTSLFGFFKDGGKVNGYAGGGGVSGPRTDSQNGLFEDGYVPPADLPIGQLMVADPPSDQGGGGGLSDVIKLIGSFKNGGVAGGRHGYATDGYVGPNSAEEARRRYLENEGSVIDSLLANQPASAAAPRNIGKYMPPAGGLAAGPSEELSRRLMAEYTPNRPETSASAPEMQSSSGVAGPDFAIPSIDRAPSGVTPTLGDTPNIRAWNAIPGADKAVSQPPAAGLAADAMAAIDAAPRPAQPGMAPIQEVSYVGGPSVPDTPSGVAGKPEPIIPLKTQLDFVMHELQKPMYSGYLGNSYRSAGDAAVAFDKIYERSGGAGNDRAAANAEDIYAAAQAGDMSGLPPNVVTAYNHFVQNGMDPVQAAGATGRLMVESYAHIDPNARNTLGGGNGTYGAAQWRGPRMEELANFAGVPLESLTGAPVSTPEGRYYPSSSREAGGLGAASMPQEPRGGGLGQGQRDPLRINKPYEDRNLIGKFFHDRETGKLNPDAVLSLLSGLGAMGQARTVSPIGAILAGLGGGAAAYADLREKAPTRVAQNLKNNQTAVAGYQMYQMGGGKLPYSEWVKTLPDAGVGYLSGGNGDQAAPVGSPSGKIGYNDLMNGTVMIGGKEVPMFNDPNSLRRYINENSIFRGMEGNPIAGTLANAEARLAEIEAKGGVTFDKDGNEIVIPSYVSAANQVAENAANREATVGFRAAGAERIPQIDQQMAEIGKQAVIFSGLEGAAFNTDKAAVQAALGAVGFDVPDSVATTQQAVKIAASQMLGELGSGNLPGGAPAAELSRLQQIVADPNLQPEAIKTILSMKKAQLMRERDRYNARAQWEAENGEMNDMDQLAYEQWFAENRPFEGYLKEAHDSLPIFAGELGSKQKPYQVKSDEDFDKVPFGGFFVGPDGVTRQNSVRSN